MIVVTTPTGDIGSRVLAHALDAGRDARVVVRDPAKLARGVRERADVVVGSHGGADVIARALDGATSVFWLPPGPPTAEGPEEAYVDFSRAFCDALPASSVTHVVGVSALGRCWDKPAGHVTASLAMDDMIGATGVAYRALTCASLMDNIARQADAIRDMGAFLGVDGVTAPRRHLVCQGGSATIHGRERSCRGLSSGVGVFQVAQDSASGKAWRQKLRRGQVPRPVP